jgi:hypothetical protein
VAGCSGGAPPQALSSSAIGMIIQRCRSISSLHNMLNCSRIAGAARPNCSLVRATQLYYTMGAQGCNKLRTDREFWPRDVQTREWRRSSARPRPSALRPCRARHSSCLCKTRCAGSAHGSDECCSSRRQNYILLKEGGAPHNSRSPMFCNAPRSAAAIESDQLVRPSAVTYALVVASGV